MSNDEIPTFTGSSEEIDAAKKQWDKEKAGIIADLQKEREQRRSVEERLERIETSLTMADSDGEKPEDEVNLLAANPRGYVSERIKEAIEPWQREVVSLRTERKIERAKKWIAKQEKIDADEIDGSDMEKELVRIGNQHQLVTLDPEEGIKAAYKIYRQEKSEKEEREKNRDAEINANQSERVGAAPRTFSTVWTREKIAALSDKEFDAHLDEIKALEKAGKIK